MGQTGSWFSPKRDKPLEVHLWWQCELVLEKNHKIIYKSDSLNTEGQWTMLQAGMYSISFAYQRFIPHKPEVHWWKMVWHKNVTPKRAFFWWLIMKKRSPTKDRLNSISRERNRRVFEGVEMPFQCFKDYFIKSLYFWDKGIFCYSSLDLLDFVDSVHMGCV